MIRDIIDFLFVDHKVNVFLLLGLLIILNMVGHLVLLLMCIALAGSGVLFAWSIATSSSRDIGQTKKMAIGNYRRRHG